MNIEQGAHVFVSVKLAWAKSLGSEGFSPWANTIQPKRFGVLMTVILLPLR